MLDVAELHRLAQQGATLLAPNLRAAKQLRSQIAALATSPDEAAALADRVLHWRAWTAGLWREALLQGRDERVLLQPLQERLLWEHILAADPGVEPTDALLDLCISATELLYQYNADEAFSAERIANASNDHARFAGWFRSFDQRCSRDMLLPGAALEAALAAQPQPAPQAATTVVLCNLAGLSPAQNGLLASLARHGTAVLEAPQTTAPAVNRILLRCRDDTDELQQLAQHMTRALEAPQRPNIAVIVPDLSSARNRIDRTLREHLQAASTHFTDDRRPLWEFSTGRPLAAAGVVADALHLLTWTVRELEAGAISILLRSPHLEWPIDAETAASLDAALLRRRPHLRGTWSPRTAALLLSNASPALTDALIQRTKSWPALHHTTASFSALAERARRVLRDFGWLRSGDRTSAEFQAVSRFEHLLDDLASLDLIGGDPPTWSAFLDRLTSAARATSFARENTGAPIQILTPDESTGIEAADLWVLHSAEDRWSSRATPHPLLPWPLQQSHGMPGTDPALDQLRLREQIERIAQVAPVATFSYAHTGEAGEQRPSSTVAALPFMDLRDADPTGTLATLHASAELEIFRDGPLFPLTLTGGQVPGGVSTLQSQAACAFRAFAERRLGSANLDTRDLGLNARDRGSLLHSALQIFWQDTQDSKTLQRLIAEGQLATAIHRAVDHALRTHRDPSDRWSESYLEIQRTRLERLLDRWLRLEAERPSFRIAALERELTVTIGALPLKVGIDRVDEVTLPDGSKSHVFLDYKTGSQTDKKWTGDRPDEPQLPLYATSALPQIAAAADTPVGAIAFAVVRAGDNLKFVSAPTKSAWLSQDPKASTATLDTDLENWRRTLETLAEDFAAGTASVGPKEYPATCRYCDQRLLCRLNPALLDVEDPEVDA